MVVLSVNRIIAVLVSLLVSFYIGFHTGRNELEVSFYQHCPPSTPALHTQPKARKSVARKVRSKPCPPAAPAVGPVAPAVAPATDTCPPPAVEHLVLNSHMLRQPDDSVLYNIFGALHHPSPITNLKSEVILSNNKGKYSNHSDCLEMYLTRSGSRSNMPNKCVAVVTAGAGDVSPVRISHRIGTQAGMTDRYAADMHADHTDKHEMPQAFMQDRQVLIDLFLAEMGDPIDPVTGERRVAFVMLANSGMVDLVINFMCSARAANIDLKDVVVFVGDHESKAIMENLGLKSFMHPSAGMMPKQAAGFYGDKSFTYMMWLKVTSVYIASTAGFDVLFQVRRNSSYLFSILF
jgi:hypothetical protein